MTEKEKIMYQVMGNITESAAPLVFKGALVTKLILSESGYTKVERQTKDIDANWVDTPPSIEMLAGTISRSLDGMNPQLYAVAFRDYDETTSAGLSIRRNDTDEEVLLMDISVKPVYGSRIYHYGEVGIKGVLANEILADKISVLSKNMIFRRAKDIVDVYALAHCVSVNTSDIYYVLKNNPNRTLGNFEEFNNRRQDVEFAYEKLRNIEEKPPFDDVYAYLKKFIQPFAEKDMSEKVWNHGKLSWEKPSMLEKLREYENEIAKKDKERQKITQKRKDKDIELS